MDWSDMVVRVMADWLLVPIFLISFVLLARLPKDRARKAIILAVVTLVLAFIIGRLFSVLYTGERPYIQMGVPPGAWASDNPGFPSEHALVVFSMAFIIWATTHHRKATYALLAMAVLVALGRVLALVHTPLDVVAGGCIAFLAAAIVYRHRLFNTH